MVARLNGDAGPGRPARKRCAIYTRKSTDKNLHEEVTTLVVQREACENWVRSQVHLPWDVLPTRYDDGGYSGANMDRPRMKQLMADVEAGRVDVIIVYKLDRLSRSLADFIQLIQHLDKYGVAFVCVTQNFSTADPVGRFTLQILMAFAELERSMIIDRVRDRVRSARARGKWVGGPPPLGYHVRDKKLQIDPEWAPLATEVIMRWLECGAHRTMLQLNAAEKLRPWRTKASSRPGPRRQWTKNDVLQLVKSAVYGGYLEVDGQMIRGEHQALIDESTFATVRAKLAENARGLGGRKAAYLLSGLLKCGHCGAAMTGVSGGNRLGRKYRYYRCTTRDKRGAAACPGRPFAADGAEMYVVEKLREAARLGDIAAGLTADAQAEVVSKQALFAEERRGLAQYIEMKEGERAQAVAALTKAQEATQRALDDLIVTLSDHIDEATSRFADLDQRLSALEDATVEAAWVAETLSNLDRVWDLLAPENRHRLLHAVVSRIEALGADAPIVVQFDTAVLDRLLRDAGPVGNASELGRAGAEQAHGAG
jgi:site-specific DNA recombinase